MLRSSQVDIWWNGVDFPPPAEYGYPAFRPKSAVADYRFSPHVFGIFKDK
jgi:hypothetical protein